MKYVESNLSREEQESFWKYRDKLRHLYYNVELKRYYDRMPEMPLRPINESLFSKLPNPYI